jgi:hypothetical protein
VVWQGGAIDVSAAEAAAGALAEAAAGSVLEANGEELVVARLRGLPWSFNAVEVRRRTLTQRRWPLGGGLVLLTVLVCSARYRGGALCGSTSCREVTAGRCRSRASRAGAGGGGGGGATNRVRTPADRAPRRPPCLSGLRLRGRGGSDGAAGGGDDAPQRGG